MDGRHYSYGNSGVIMANLELSFTESEPVQAAAAIPPAVAGHSALASLVAAELAKPAPRSGYFRGLAALERDPIIRRALLDIAIST